MYFHPSQPSDLCCFILVLTNRTFSSQFKITIRDHLEQHCTILADPAVFDAFHCISHIVINNLKTLILSNLPWSSFLDFFQFNRNLISQYNNLWQMLPNLHLVVLGGVIFSLKLFICDPFENAACSCLWAVFSSLSAQKIVGKRLFYWLLSLSWMLLDLARLHWRAQFE